MLTRATTTKPYVTTARRSVAKTAPCSLIFILIAPKLIKRWALWTRPALIVIKLSGSILRMRAFTWAEATSVLPREIIAVRRRTLKRRLGFLGRMMLSFSEFRLVPSYMPRRLTAKRKAGA